MTNQTVIQARINHGLGIAANVLGAAFNQFRPSSQFYPMSGRPYAVLQAAFDGDPKFSFRTPLVYGKAVVFGIFDATSVLAGDLLFSATGGTYFIGGLEPTHSRLCVRCNAMINVTRGAQPVAMGAQAPLNVQEGSETVIAQEWPASILREGRGERGDTSLPDDVKLGGFILLLPSTLPAAMRSGDVISIVQWLDASADPMSVRIIVSMAEATNAGWRLLGMEAAT